MPNILRNHHERHVLLSLNLLVKSSSSAQVAKILPAMRQFRIILLAIPIAPLVYNWMDQLWSTQLLTGWIMQYKQSTILSPIGNHYSSSLASMFVLSPFAIHKPIIENIYRAFLVRYGLLRSHGRF